MDLNNKSVLILEDASMIAERLRAMVIDIGGDQVHTCRSGADAIVLARQHQPSIVFADQDLAGTLTGVETVRAIRQFLDVPVVFISSHLDQVQESEQPHLSRTFLLDKPIYQDQLEQTLAQIF